MRRHLFFFFMKIRVECFQCNMNIFWDSEQKKIEVIFYLY